MTASGRYIPGKQREAAFASMMLPEKERNELRAREAAAQEVLSRFDLHHIKYFSWGGSNRWHNIDPQLKADHKARTQTDIGIIAKSKRLKLAEELHGAAMQGKAGHGPAMQCVAKHGKARKIPSRPFPKAKRKLRRKK